MIKRVFLVFFVLLFSNLAFAAPLNLDLGDNQVSGEDNFVELDTLSYLFFYNDLNSSTNKISYEINYLGGESKYFELYLEYDESRDKICSYDLEYVQGEERYEKVTCEVSKLGSGEYEFSAYLKDSSGEEIDSLTNIEFVYDEISANQEFIDMGDKTQVVLHIDGSLGDFKIASRIPKEVIENLNDNNKADLILSDSEYEILDEDPLIAWSVEEIPSDINYTINKKVSIEDREKFRIEVVDNKSFKIMNYVVILLVGLILFFIFKPMFKR